MITFSYGQLRGVDSAIPGALAKIFNASFGFRIDRRFFPIRDVIFREQQNLEAAEKKAIETVNQEYPEPQRNGRSDDDWAALIVDLKKKKMARVRDLQEEIFTATFDIDCRAVEIPEDVYESYENREQKKEIATPGSGLILTINELAELERNGILTIKKNDCDDKPET